MSDLNKSLQAVHEANEKYQRSVDKLTFHYELYKLQKELNETNRRLRKLEEKIIEREISYKRAVF